jgi:hypothetical protein
MPAKNIKSGCGSSSFKSVNRTRQVLRATVQPALAAAVVKMAGKRRPLSWVIEDLLIEAMTARGISLTVKRGAVHTVDGNGRRWCKSTLFLASVLHYCANGLVVA